MNKLIAAIVLTTIATTGQATTQGCEDLASLLDQYPLPAQLDGITTLTSVTYSLRHCTVNFSYSVDYQGVDKGEGLYDNSEQLEVLRANNIRIRHIYRSVNGRHMFSQADVLYLNEVDGQ